MLGSGRFESVPSNYIMKIKFAAFLTAGCLLAGNLLAQTAAPSAVKAPERSAVATELQQVVTKIQAKLKEGKKSEADLAPELSEFDAILAKHKSEKTDDVAQVLMMKAMLYSQVLGNEAKGDELMEQLQRDFPDSKQAAMLKKQEASKKIQAGLKAGMPFPDFAVKDTNGKPLSLAAYKGKVVLIDFWATWCGPCVKELPNVLDAYEKHHAGGFEIIGISLDSDRAKLDTFVKEKNMPWVQFFDGKGWQNELAQKYGINSIPATYLIDGEGKIIASGLRGDKLEAAVAAALAKK